MSEATPLQRLLNLGCPTEQAARALAAAEAAGVPPGGFVDAVEDFGLGTLPALVRVLKLLALKRPAG